MGKFTGHSITSDSALGSAVIERSLKFNRGDAPYLQATLGDGNEDKWTWSGWVKKTVNGQHQNLFSSGSDAVYTHINFDNNDRIRFQNWHSAQKGTKITTRKIRDLSSWMHIVVIWDSGNATADDRMRIYVNGTRETTFDDSTNPDQNQDSVINGNSLGGSTYGEGKHFIGKFADTSDNSGTYKTEINFVDGYAYDPSYFGFTESQTGAWMPKRYEGVYGSNGFRLDFSDNSSTSTLGIDKSPNGNDFTANNFSVSAGVGDDSSLDTPSNNFCTLNPLKTNPSARITFTEGNLQHNGVSGNNHLRSHSTMSVGSGKWYVEFKFISGYETANDTVQFGICTSGGHRDSNNDSLYYENSINFKTLRYTMAGTFYVTDAGSTSSTTSGLTTFANGDVMGIALDMDNYKFYISKNGTFFSNGTGTQDPVTGANPLYSGAHLSSRRHQGWFFSISGYSAQVVTADFGQQGFDYTPPTGFKSVCARNMKPELSPAVLNPEKHFKCIVYSGTGSTNQIDTIGFKPDLVWVKRKDDSSYHILTDSINGAGNYFVSNTADGLSSGGAQLINQFRDNGFQVGTENAVNNSSGTYSAWCWKAGGAKVANTDGSINSQVSANTEAGFSIVQYTGTGASGTVGHGLGRSPRIIFFRNHNGEGHDWNVYYNTPQGYGAGVRYLQLNTNIIGTYATNKYDGTASSTTLTVNTAADNNQSGQTITAYCWAQIPGYSRIGIYRGNGNDDGEFVHTGFRPRWVWVKNLDSTQNWQVWDAARETENEMDQVYEFNSQNNSGSSSNTAIDFLAMGFKHRTSFQRSNNTSDFLFMAIAETVGRTPFDTFSNAR